MTVAKTRTLRRSAPSLNPLAMFALIQLLRLSLVVTLCWIVGTIVI